jgi:hypothetical protein
LSRSLVHSAFTQAVSAATFTTIDTQTWYEFRKTKGDLKELVRQIISVLTGLNEEQLESRGYVVVNTNTDQTVAFVLPTEVGSGFMRRSGRQGVEAAG